MAHALEYVHSVGVIHRRSAIAASHLADLVSICSVHGRGHGVMDALAYPNDLQDSMFTHNRITFQHLHHLYILPLSCIHFNKKYSRQLAMYTCTSSYIFTRTVDVGQGGFSEGLRFWVRRNLGTLEPWIFHLLRPWKF